MPSVSGQGRQYAHVRASVDEEAEAEGAVTDMEKATWGRKANNDCCH